MVILKHRNGTNEEQLFNNDRCDLGDLHEYSLAKSYGQDCYIAAAVEDSIIRKRPVTIDIGDGGSIRGYGNVPLEKNSIYSATLAIFFTMKVGKQLTCTCQKYYFIETDI